MPDGLGWKNSLAMFTKKNLLTFTFILVVHLALAVNEEVPLFFGSFNELSQLQNAIKKEGTTHQLAFREMKQRVDAHDLSIYIEEVNRYNRSYFVQEAAALSLLLTAEKEKAYYAQVAFEGIKDIYENPAQERLPHQDYGLSRAMMQLALAMPYAWCRDHWSKEQLTYVENKINEALESWLSYKHANFGDTRGSNWVAVCRGGEVVLMLAAGKQEEFKARYQFLVEQLRLHIQNGYGSLGVSQEGIGYTEYGGTFLHKAIQATASVGDSILWKEANKHEWWKQAMYIESFQGNHRKYLMTGVAPSGGISEGWTSLLFKQVPQEFLPYFTWWYDRHQGKHSAMKPAEKYDYLRGGTIWAILNYPLEITPKDPTGVFEPAVKDSHGYHFFRNRWQDENDILFSIMADEAHHGHAWDQPEVFALNLMAYNSRFIGGPCKERTNDLYSTLLVNGDYNIKKSVRLKGATDSWNVDDDQVSVTVDGGALYEALGLKEAKRSCTLKFLPDNRAIIILRDEVKSDKTENYTWQLNVGNHIDTEVVNVSKEGDSFTFTGHQGLVKGWVLSETLFSFNNADDPFQINFSGKNEQLTVLLYLTPDLQDKSVPKRIKKGRYQFQKQEIWVNKKVMFK